MDWAMRCGGWVGEPKGEQSSGDDDQVLLRLPSRSRRTKACSSMVQGHGSHRLTDGPRVTRNTADPHRTVAWIGSRGLPPQVLGLT